MKDEDLMGEFETPESFSKKMDEVLKTTKECCQTCGCLYDDYGAKVCCKHIHAIDKETDIGSHCCKDWRL